MPHEAVVMVEALDRPVAEIHLADPATEAAALQGAALDATAIVLDHRVIPDMASGPDAAEAGALGEPVLTAAAVADLDVAGAIPVDTDAALDLALAGDIHDIVNFDTGSHDGSSQDSPEGSLDPLARTDILEYVDNGGQANFALFDEADALGAGLPVWGAELESFVSSMRATYDATTSGNTAGAFDQGSGPSMFGLLPIGSILAFAQGQISTFGLDPATSLDPTLPDPDVLLAIASTDWTTQGLDAQLEAFMTVAALFSGAGEDNDVIAIQDLLDEGQQVQTLGGEGVPDGGQAGDALLAQHQQVAAFASGFPVDGPDILMDPFATLDPSTFG
jgi:hypothetical protein